MTGHGLLRPVARSLLGARRQPSHPRPQLPHRDEEERPQPAAHVVGQAALPEPRPAPPLGQDLQAVPAHLPGPVQHHRGDRAERLQRRLPADQQRVRQAGRRLAGRVLPHGLQVRRLPPRPRPPLRGQLRLRLALHGQRQGPPQRGALRRRERPRLLLQPGARLLPRLPLAQRQHPLQPRDEERAVHRRAVQDPHVQLDDPLAREPQVALRRHLQADPPRQDLRQPGPSQAGLLPPLQGGHRLPLLPPGRPRLLELGQHGKGLLVERRREGPLLLRQVRPQAGQDRRRPRAEAQVQLGGSLHQLRVRVDGRVVPEHLQGGRET